MLNASSDSVNVGNGQVNVNQSIVDTLSASAYTSKVSENNNYVLCQNKFSSLYPGDNVVSFVTDDNEVSSPLPAKNWGNS